MPITLPNGQVIQETDPNYATYLAQQKASAAPVANATASVTPAMTLTDAQKAADTALSGLATPMSLTDIRAAETAQKAAVLQGAEAQFNPQIATEKKAGETVLSSAIGATGQRQGFNLSTAESAYLAGVQNDITARIKAVEDQKASAIATGNLAAITRAEENIAKLNDAQTNIAIQKANYALQLVSSNIAQRQLEATTASNKETQDLQSQELALNAYKTALETPVGKDFTINGITYTGMADLSGTDPANISVETDDDGFQVGIDKTTGEVLWKSKTPTGKSKTAATSVNVNLKNSAIGGVEDKMYNVDGNQIGTRSYNQQTGKWTYQDMGGNTISAPMFYSTEKPETSGSIELSNGSGKTIKIK